METRNIKNYLFLYLGCEVEWWNGEGNYILDTYYLAEIDEDNLWEKTKPILRPLSSMKEEEKKEGGNLDYDFSGEPDLNKWNPEDFETLLSANQFLWLLSKHFDLFGLIEAGLAIDATKILNNGTKQ